MARLRLDCLEGKKQQDLQRQGRRLGTII